eukprot:3355552-Prymnesium_polylepis.2
MEGGRTQLTHPMCVCCPASGLTSGVSRGHVWTRAQVEAAQKVAREEALAALQRDHRREIDQ